MKKILASLVLAICTLAGAADYNMAYNNGNVKVTLTQEACGSTAVSAALAAVAKPGTGAKAAFVEMSSSPAVIQACWAIDSGSDVYIIDAMGDSGFIPMKDFKPVPVDDSKKDLFRGV